MKTFPKPSVMLAVTAMFLAILACGGLTASPTGNNGSQDSQRTTTSPPPVAVDPHTAITKTFNDFAKAPPYHVTMTITTNGSTLQEHADVILPDHFHITTERNGQTTEMLIVGDKTYNKVNGRWVESPFDTAGLTSGFTDALGKDTTVSNVKFVKSDMVNGQSTRVYTYDSHYDAEGFTVDSATTMWVSTANGLPIKLEIDSHANDIQSHIEQSIEYDSGIKIEVPNP